MGLHWGTDDHVCRSPGGTEDPEIQLGQQWGNNTELGRGTDATKTTVPI
jgi:hypothetical protein